MARLLHGRPVAERIKAATRERAQALGGAHLAVVSVAADAAAVSYRDGLVRAGRDVEVKVSARELPRTASEGEVAAALDEASADAEVHGILLLTPLPGELDLVSLSEHIAPPKDVEGMHPSSVGRLWLGRRGFVPTTAEAIVELLHAYDVPLAGRRAAVIGRSAIVGRPVTQLLLAEDATVTVLHRATTEPARFTREADVVVVAIGSAGWLKGDMVRPGAAVVDAGINVTPSGIVGDVDAESVGVVAECLSPVPGGVGAVTRALLLRNVVTAAERLRNG